MGINIRIQWHALGGNRIPMQRQWEIALLAASVAISLVDAQLVTGSRLRAAQVAARERDQAERGRKTVKLRLENARLKHLLTKGKALLNSNRSAVLSGRVQLDLRAAKRQQLQTFLACIAARPDQ